MFYFFFFNDTATTEIYTLSLHDALPISEHARHRVRADRDRVLHRHLLQLPHAPPFPDRPAALTLGLADDPVHGTHRLERELPRRGFGREHHGVGAVEDGVRHVRGLRPRGARMVGHRLEHLRGRDDRLAAPVRLPD